ncbi:FadR/GntR family transcriptional regulator [Devosia sp.]|uniref:FadR/GntR family transcriptional regulator n=1 Tax=Devosia sp. TaxID=1871048 RepID=UPI003BABBE83
MSDAGSLIRSLSGRPAARNFHTFVINEIGAGIITGRFPIGSILPTDAVMMENYGVSRTVLREALRTLEAKGLVEARPKVGTRVSPSSRWNLFDAQVLSWHFEAQLDRRFIESLFDVRQALERRAADLAVRHRTAEQVRLLKYWVHQMDLSADSVEQHALADLEVHRLIAETSRNPLLRSVTGVVELTLALAATSGSLAERHETRLASTLRHEALVVAIEAGDPVQAAAAIDAIVVGDLTHTMKRFASPEA